MQRENIIFGGEPLPKLSGLCTINSTLTPQLVSVLCLLSPVWACGSWTQGMPNVCCITGSVCVPFMIIVSCWPNLFIWFGWGAVCVCLTNKNYVKTCKYALSFDLWKTNEGSPAHVCTLLIMITPRAKYIVTVRATIGCLCGWQRNQSPNEKEDEPRP